MYQHDQTVQERLINFMYGVYGLMSGALTLTAITAYFVAQIPNIEVSLFGSPLLMTLIFIGQFALVLGLGFMIQRLTFPMALTMFLVYSISMGITMSVIFLVYTQASIVQTFAVTAGMFGIMTIYGYLTHTDLTKLGNVMIMILWGLILAVLVNLFLRNPLFDLLISAAMVIVFTALTAYDTQKIKQIGQHMMADDEMMAKVAVIGALTLYLDFVNLFLYLLRFMGRRRD